MTPADAALLECLDAHRNVRIARDAACTNHNAGGEHSQLAQSDSPWQSSPAATTAPATGDDAQAAAEAKLRKKAARMAAAAELQKARTDHALRSRAHAISAAAERARIEAKEAEERRQIERSFQKQRLAREREQAEVRAARDRKAARARFEQAKKRAVMEEEFERAERELRNEHERARRERESQIEAEIRRAAAAEPRPAAEAQKGAARHSWTDSRAEERFRTFEQDAAKRKYRDCHPGLSPLFGHTAPALPSAPPLLGSEIEHAATEVLALHALRHQGCPHRVLGLAPNAKTAAVRKRYLALALRLHPDKTDHPSAASAFSAIEAAFRAMQHREPGGKNARRTA